MPDGGINALSGLRSFLRAPPQDRQAQRRRAGHFKLRTCGCAGWRHQCLIRPTFLPAGPHPRTGKRSAAGRSGSIPAVVPDGGIHALSGLRSFPRDPTPGPASAAPPGSQPRALVASSILYLWLNWRAIRSSFIINSSVTPTSTMVSAEPSAILPRSVRLKMVTGSVVQPGG